MGCIFGSVPHTPGLGQGLPASEPPCSYLPMRELALPSLTFQDPKGFGAKESVEKQVVAHHVTLITGKAKVCGALTCADTGAEALH